MKQQDTPPNHGRGLATRSEESIAANTSSLVVGPYMTERASQRAEGRSHASRLDEAVGLASAIDLNISGAEIAPLKAPRPATYVGKGKVEEIRQKVVEQDIGLVIFDCALTPIQQRNLERELSTKVIDRTGLILEIFGRRAKTREGALQVEMAHLNYQKSRLVRSWTHLERQRGGFGFLGGPGETQIEADRRLLQDRLKRLERDLDDVKRTRGLHRASRDKVPFPTVALVGYTNAGKSTLFNRLTNAAVLAKDMLFATLDPTTRLVALPHGEKIILSDTVGFISDLPTALIAAFRATLEDVIAADVILHVRDMAHPDADAQKTDVASIMESLGIGEHRNSRIIEIWNKADLLAETEAARLLELSTLPGEKRPVLVSAVTGQGIDTLRAAIEARLTIDHIRYRVVIPSSDGALLGWLHDHGSVRGRSAGPDGIMTLEIKVPPERAGLLEQKLGSSASRLS